MIDTLYITRVGDAILQDPSLRKVEGYISVNYIYDVDLGVYIYTNDLELFKKVKYIFIVSSLKSIGTVKITDIRFYEPDAELKKFGGPIKMDYYISTENSQSLAKFKLRNL